MPREPFNLRLLGEHLLNYSAALVVIGLAAAVMLFLLDL